MDNSRKTEFARIVVFTFVVSLIKLDLNPNNKKVERIIREIFLQYRYTVIIILCINFSFLHGITLFSHNVAINNDNIYA